MERKYMNKANSVKMLRENSFDEDIDIFDDDMTQDTQGFEEEIEEPVGIENEAQEDFSEEPVMKIRKYALDGVQKYENDVDCVQYEFYKKIWDMCDKIMSHKEKNTVNNGK